jgi:hypothetical protein
MFSIEPSLEEMKFIVWRTHGCNFGTCRKCLRNCRILGYRRILKTLKPSFCQGQPLFCLRDRKQGCKECRTQNIDLNVKGSSVDQPQQKTKQKLGEVISELEALAGVKK